MRFNLIKVQARALIRHSQSHTFSQDVSGIWTGWIKSTMDCINCGSEILRSSFVRMPRTRRWVRGYTRSLDRLERGKANERRQRGRSEKNGRWVILHQLKGLNVILFRSYWRRNPISKKESVTITWCLGWGQAYWLQDEVSWLMCQFHALGVLVSPPSPRIYRN